MSTRIYDAYRFDQARLEEFIQIFNEACFAGIKSFSEKYRLSDECIAEARKNIFVHNPDNSKKWSDDDIGLAQTFAFAIQCSKSLSRELFDLDCSFNLWFHKGKCYVIPYVPRGLDIHWGKLLPEWAEYYGYWDNSDAQEGIPEEEWEKRGEVWEDICLNDWDKTRLSHIVVEFKPRSVCGIRPLLKYMGKDKKPMEGVSWGWEGSIYTMMFTLYWKEEGKKKEEEDKKTFERILKKQEEAKQESVEESNENGSQQS